MKYLFIVAAVAIICFVFARNTPVKSVTEAVTASAAAPLTADSREPAPPARTNILKAPLDRTHAVLEDAKRRHGAAEF